MLLNSNIESKVETVVVRLESVLAMVEMCCIEQQTMSHVITNVFK